MSFKKFNVETSIDFTNLEINLSKVKEDYKYAIIDNSDI